MALPSPDAYRRRMQPGLPHVLFVNVTVDESEMYGYWLTSEGYRISTATSVASALSVIGADPVDLVVVDLGYPDGEGAALAKQLTAFHFRPRIIALYGYLFSRDLLAEARPDLLLMKPCLPHELGGAVSRLLTGGPVGNSGLQLH